MENKILNKYDIIKGLLLLILAISGNFIAETLSCPVQKLLTENIYVKHIITILILYFSTGIIQNNDAPLHPYVTLKICILAYVIFLFFTKMDMNFTCFSFLIVAAIYINFTFLDYYKKIEPNKINDIKFHKKVNIFLFILLYLVLIIGFIKYYLKNIKKNRNLFSIIKFIFDLKKCYN